MKEAFRPSLKRISDGLATAEEARATINLILAAVPPAKFERYYDEVFQALRRYNTRALQSLKMDDELELWQDLVNDHQKTSYEMGLVFLSGQFRTLSWNYGDLMRMRDTIAVNHSTSAPGIVQMETSVGSAPVGEARTAPQPPKPHRPADIGVYVGPRKRGKMADTRQYRLFN